MNAELILERRQKQELIEKIDALTKEVASLRKENVELRSFIKNKLDKYSNTENGTTI